MLSKSQARAFFLGGTGVFTAAFLALTVDSMRQVPAMTNEEKLTEEVIAGKVIWEKNNCMGCHTLFGEGAYYAPELTKVVERRGEAWIKLFLKDPEKMFPGERKMVNYHFSDEEIEHVVAFLEWCGHVDLNGFPAKPPLGRVAAPIVTTGHSDVPQPEMFKTICTACHTVGGVGGKVGPALDTIGGKMEREALKAWISDPQKIKPGTAMPQIPMTPEQLDELADYLLSLSNGQ
ncbi:cytochrome c [Verrucomicrobiaceae bacterium 227]